VQQKVSSTTKYVLHYFNSIEKKVRKHSSSKQTQSSSFHLTIIIYDNTQPKTSHLSHNVDMYKQVKREIKYD